jgi:peptidoglycan-N-acetylglucosamine deacetylase
MRRRYMNITLGAFLPTLAMAAVMGYRIDSPAGPTPPPQPPPHAQAKPAPRVNKYWARAKEEVYKSTMQVIKQRQKELAEGDRYRVFDRGSTRRKWLALTIDDGPHSDTTPQLLAVLKRHNVKATFFVVGMMAEKYPDLIRAEALQGHEIANHTYHHVNLTKVPQPAMATEIKACGKVIQSITGKAPGLFRPPGGDYNRTVAETVGALGYTMVLWTDDPGDYASPGAKLVETRVLHDLSNGGILLLHDGIQQTVQLLPQLLDLLKRKGYQFVTVDQMMGVAPPPPGPPVRH